MAQNCRLGCFLCVPHRHAPDDVVFMFTENEKHFHDPIKSFDGMATQHGLRQHLNDSVIRDRSKLWVIQAKTFFRKIFRGQTLFFKRIQGADTLFRKKGLRRHFIEKIRVIREDFFSLQNLKIQDFIFQKKPFLKIRK